MKYSLVALYTLLIFLSNAVPYSYASTPAYTVILNQVRGTECCDPGKSSYFANQMTTLRRLNLPATFAFRYDALIDTSFTRLIQPTQFERAAFLEITPSLALASGVTYTGTSADWFKAEHAYLVGYSQNDRKKLIDTYMSAYFATFNEYPQTTVAWVIDAWSLSYLRQHYGILVHEITREQFGTDSYTLYGGPPHYPYSPSSLWAMVPSSSQNSEMPLIIRQTITDPLENYGDVTSGFTSQPNDYMSRKADISYFKHLYSQAHAQKFNNYTWALLGLENSMPREVQDEYVKQLEFVNQWRTESPNNRVITAREFAQHNNVSSYPHVYASDNAWWITTPTYRARLRLDNQELYLDDVRIYDTEFSDPYNDTQADQNAQWIVPFVLDGSRYFYRDPQFRLDGIARDSLTVREHTYPEPTRLSVFKGITSISVKRVNNSITFSQPKRPKPLATFHIKSFELPAETVYKTENEVLEKRIEKLTWRDSHYSELWGLREKRTKEMISYSPFVHKPVALQTEREKHYPLLFPSVKDHPLDPKKTYTLVHNSYAVAGRNPVRVVLYPRDAYKYPVKIDEFPILHTSIPIDATDFDTQQVQNGMMFLDFVHSKPLKTVATVKLGSYSHSFTIYFAPQCKADLLYCVRHPVQALWYVRSSIEDRMRKMNE